VLLPTPFEPIRHLTRQVSGEAVLDRGFGEGVEERLGESDVASDYHTSNKEEAVIVGLNGSCLVRRLIAQS
jgi:hypothetical protein